jgi:uncharacterized membrane protein
MALSKTAVRFDAIDALRGAAIVWMTVFHFCFDLNQFGYVKQNFYIDPFWTTQRIAIVSLFVFCAGLSQAIAVHQGQTVQRFWRRWAQVAVCALLVSAGSYWMYPKSFIYFGVLHGIAVMLIIVRLTGALRLRSNAWWLLGAIAIAMPFIAARAHAYWPELSFLNEKAFNWIGLISKKPITEDYVPLVPWLGVMCWGMAAGQTLLARRHGWLLVGLPKTLVPVAWLGRWSLSWYMLHQPVMIGMLMLAEIVAQRVGK